MEVLKTEEHRKHQPCTFDEAACCRRLHWWLRRWSWYRLLSRVNHAPTRKFCESVCENKSVKITRSEMHVSLWCHTTWKTLTGCVVVAEVVTPHPVRCFAGQSRPGSSASARIDHWLYFGSSSIPVNEIIPVYSHLGTHAISVVNSSGSKIIIMTYECVEPSSDSLPWMAVYVTCSSVAGTISSREPLTIKYKKLWYNTFYNCNGKEIMYRYLQYERVTSDLPRGSRSFWSRDTLVPYKTPSQGGRLYWSRLSEFGTETFHYIAN